jgi:predicted AlkP superfamily phosphohydrolase/phosphomutase
MLPHTNIAVFSDHGAGPCLKAVFVNKWLEEKGYMAYANGGLSSVDVLKACHYRIKNLVPAWGLELLKRALPGLRQRVKSKLVFSEVDWSRTKVFAFGRESTNLFVNLKGKFPGGVVEKADYEALLARVTEELSALKDPESGLPAVGRVYRRDEVYQGECLDFAPDLLVTWRNHEYTSWPGYDDRNREVFESSLKHSDYSDWSQLQKGGNHRPNGLVLLAGEGVRPGVELTGSRIIDMAPTLLYWLDVAIPADMDGQVLGQAFEAGYLEGRPPRAGAAGDSGAGARHDIYSEAESKAIEERLRGLGYIE